MSARGDEITRRAGECASECGRCGAASARVIPVNQGIFAQRPVYPLLMIDGVYRMSSANLQEGRGLAVYALPLLSPSISRHRARVKVRHARRAFLKTCIEHGADVGPRDHEP